MRYSDIATDARREGLTFQNCPALWGRKTLAPHPAHCHGSRAADFVEGAKYFVRSLVGWKILELCLCWKLHFLPPYCSSPVTSCDFPTGCAGLNFVHLFLVIITQVPSECSSFHL